MFLREVYCMGCGVQLRGSHLITDYLFWPLKQYSGGHLFHRNGVEMSACPWLQMQEPNLYCREIFKLTAWWYKCIYVLGITLKINYA
jgi:hypothetical protein